MALDIGPRLVGGEMEVWQAVQLASPVIELQSVARYGVLLPDGKVLVVNF